MADNTDDELSELILDPGDNDQLEAISVASKESTRRGRKKAEDQWTRVISVSCDDLANIRSFSLATDFLINEGKN